MYDTGYDNGTGHLKKNKGRHGRVEGEFRRRVEKFKMCPPCKQNRPVRAIFPKMCMGGNIAGGLFSMGHPV